MCVGSKDNHHKYLPITNCDGLDCAVNAFHSRASAAITIQRAWRKFRGLCLDQGYFPSDENEEHYKCAWAGGMVMNACAGLGIQ